MQVSLSPHADQLIARMMALGFNDPVAVVETALERMAQVELAQQEAESPEAIDWMRREVAIGAEQLDRGEFCSQSLSEIKAEVLAEYQQRGGNA